MPPISDQFRQAIRDTGRSLASICREIGWSDGEARRFMRGEVGTTTRILDRLAALLGLELTFYGFRLDPPPRLFSDQLRTVIAASGIRPVELCRLTEWTEPNERKFRKGRSHLSTRTLDRLAALFHLSLAVNGPGPDRRDAWAIMQHEQRERLRAEIEAIRNGAAAEPEPDIEPEPEQEQPEPTEPEPSPEPDRPSHLDTYARLWGRPHEPLKQPVRDIRRRRY